MYLFCLWTATFVLVSSGSMVAAYSHWPVKLAGLNMQSPEWRQRHRRSRFFGASAEALDLRKTSASSVKTSVEVIACSPSTIIIRNVLTEQECARMIEITEAMKYEYIGVGREQQAWLTWILDEDAVCTPLFERVSQFLPGMIDAPWPRKLAGLNQRCRFYKYRPNDYDEVFERYGYPIVANSWLRLLVELIALSCFSFRLIGTIQILALPSYAMRRVKPVQIFLTGTHTATRRVCSRSFCTSTMTSKVVKLFCTQTLPLRHLGMPHLREHRRSCSPSQSSQRKDQCSSFCRMQDSAIRRRTSRELWKGQSCTKEPRSEMADRSMS